MKKTKLITLLFGSCALITSCGSDPRDPVRQSASVIGAEADRREKQKQDREELFGRMKYQRQVDNLGSAAEKIQRTPRPLPRPDFSPFGN